MGPSALQYRAIGRDLAESVRQRFSRLQSGQKPRRGVPAYTLFVNRPMGRLIAAATPHWLSANGMTILAAVLSYGALGALWFLREPRAGWTLVGVVLLLAYVLDSADGQLSRLRGTSSPAGEWLDHVLDGGRIVLLHAGAARVLFEGTHQAGVTAIAAAFGTSAALIYVGGILFDKLAISGASTGAFSLWRSMLMLPVDYGVLCAIFLLLPLSTVFVVAYSVLALANILFCGAFLVTWFRRLNASITSQTPS